MKKFIYLFLAVAAFAAASCQEKMVSGAKGTLAFTLEYDGNDYIDISTKAVDFDLSSMAVVIKDAGDTEVASYPDASAMPAEIQLAPGQYTVRAYTSDVAEAGAVLFFWVRTVSMRERLKEFFPDIWQTLH